MTELISLIWYLFIIKKKSTGIRVNPDTGGQSRGDLTRTDDPLHPMQVR